MKHSFNKLVPRRRISTLVSRRNNAQRPTLVRLRYRKLLRKARAMDITGLVIQFGSGVAGGLLAGKLLKGLNLGPLGNALAGSVGGGIGVQAINSWLGLAMLSAQGGPDLGTLAVQLAAGAVGGGAATALFGLLHRLASR
jgi:hypothetical protein